MHGVIILTFIIILQAVHCLIKKVFTVISSRMIDFSKGYDIIFSYLLLFLSLLSLLLLLLLLFQRIELEVLVNIFEPSRSVFKTIVPLVTQTITIRFTIIKFRQSTIVKHRYGHRSEFLADTRGALSS